MDLISLLHQPISNVSHFRRQETCENKVISISEFNQQMTTKSNINLSSKLKHIRECLELEFKRVNVNSTNSMLIMDFVSKNIEKQLAEMPFSKISFEIVNQDFLVLTILKSRNSILKISFDMANSNETIFVFFHNLELVMNGIGTIEDVFEEINSIFPQTDKLYSEQTLLSQKASAFEPV